jgi:HK97 family phage major capsid protein
MAIFDEKLSEVLNHLVSSQKETQKTLSDLQRKMNEYEIVKQRPNFFDENEICEKKEMNDNLYHKQFVDYLKTGSQINTNYQIYPSLFEKKSLVEGACGINDNFTFAACGNGGYLISYILHKRILRIAEEENVFRKLSSYEIVPGGRHEYIQVVGKISDASWVDETTNRPVTETPKLKRLTIFLGEMYVQPEISIRLLEDSEINIIEWLSQEIADAFSGLEIQAIIDGDGLGKPEGITKNADVQTITTATTKVIAYDDLANLFNSLDIRYRQNASFVMSQKAESLIMNIKDTNGNPLWNRSMSDKIPSTLFGMPIYISNYLDEGTASGDIPIIFGDFRQGYKLIETIPTMKRDDLTKKQSMLYYTRKRVGGAVVNPDALKILKVK